MQKQVHHVISSSEKTSTVNPQRGVKMVTKPLSSVQTCDQAFIPTNALFVAISSYVVLPPNLPLWEHGYQTQVWESGEDGQKVTSCSCRHAGLALLSANH